MYITFVHLNSPQSSPRRDTDNMFDCMYKILATSETLLNANLITILCEFDAGIPVYVIDFHHVCSSGKTAMSLDMYLEQHLPPLRVAVTTQDMKEYFQCLNTVLGREMGDVIRTYCPNCHEVTFLT